MSITQSFYDSLASQYDKLFLDWQTTTQEQAVILDRLFAHNGFDKSAHILDCACGIGTQAIGLAAIGYNVTGSDISDLSVIICFVMLLVNDLYGFVSWRRMERQQLQSAKECPGLEA